MPRVGSVDCVLGLAASLSPQRACVPSLPPCVHVCLPALPCPAIRKKSEVFFLPQVTKYNHGSEEGDISMSIASFPRECVLWLLCTY